MRKRGIRERFLCHRRERKHFKKCCLQLLLIVAAPHGFTLGEEPARRLVKQYEIQRKSSHWPSSRSQKPDRDYGTTQVMSTQLGDQQMAAVPKKHDYIFWQQVWYKHFSRFQTFIYNLKVWLQAKKILTVQYSGNKTSSLLFQMCKRNSKILFPMNRDCCTTFISMCPRRSIYEIMPIIMPLLHSLWDFA